jgi:hypothetical protein
MRSDEPQLGDRLDSIQMEETPLLNRRITYLPLLNAANRPAPQWTSFGVNLGYACGWS